jgi:hypothetical protein
VAKKKQGITWTNERRKLADLIPWEHNPRTIKQKQAERLVDSVETFGQVETLAIGPTNELYNGHQRLSVLAGQYGMDYEVDVRVASRPLTERERQQLTVYLHRGATGEFDMAALADWDMGDLLTWGFDEGDFDFGEDDTVESADGTTEGSPANDKRASLSDRFVVPPFSVLDARQGYWQERKRAWLAIGIQSELGRGEASPGGSPDAATRLVNGHTVRGDGIGNEMTDRQTDRQTDRRRLTWGIDPDGQSWKRKGKSRQYGDGKRPDATKAQV